MKKTRNVTDSDLPELLIDHPPAAYFHRLAQAGLCIDHELGQRIGKYIQGYLQIAALDFAEAYKIYENFIRAYSNDMKAFEKTGLYPEQLATPIRSIERRHYDVVLLLSCLLSGHRIKLMDLLCRDGSASGNAAFIGCGPGLEIDLLRHRFELCHGFDIDLNPELAKSLPEVTFFEDSFPSAAGLSRYDAIYLIEILEHLRNPFSLLASAAKKLAPNGVLFLTTATNIPQFDHLYNFAADHSDFEDELQSFGLKIVSNDEIPHHYLGFNIGAKNHLYVVRKD